jgi:MYXO-CTERM domain-containing protein
MRFVLAVALALFPALAAAHVGGVVANANFTSPANPPTTPVDGGVVLQSGYTFPVADQSFTITWSDGDIDPTGRFFFYYWDRMPTFGVLPTDIEMKATPIQEIGNPLVPVAVYAGCMCQDDAGVVCADFSGGLMRDCRNSFNWDTSGVADGVYWIVAVNSDPPFHVYAVANAPVIVSHGAAAKKPAALVLIPDGFGSWDKQYRVQWVGQGVGPLKFDLAYGDETSPFDPVTTIANDVTPIMNPDGTYSYDWDISGLASLGTFFLRVTIHDGNGASTFTDSRYGLSVFHPGDSTDLAGPPGADLSTMMPPKSGCSCELGAGTTAAAVPLGLIVLTMLVAARLVRRRD